MKEYGVSSFKQTSNRSVRTMMKQQESYLQGMGKVVPVTHAAVEHRL